MNRPWAPVGWLLCAMLVALGWLHVSGGLTPRLEPDSNAYIDFDWSSPSAALSNIRTIGYPLFLRVAQGLGGLPRWVPLGHWAAMAIAVGVFYWGLRTAGYRRWTAVACGAVLMFSRGALELTGLVTADSLALALAVAAAGCFLAATRVSAGWGAWCGLAVSTFLAYQVRPAYLFLIPLWPLLMALFDRFLLRRQAPQADRLRRLCVVAAVTVLPFVGFCTLRWALVGHWGLVSFGGYNVIGVAGQWLDHDLAAQLPDDLQPLAREILRRRGQQGNIGPARDFASMAAMYNPTVWQLAVPAAHALNDQDPVAANHDLTRLAREILRRRPARYAQWLVWNGGSALREVLVLTVTDTGVLVMGLLLVLAHAARLIRGSRSSCEASTEPDPMQQRHLESHLLFWTAVGFAAAKSLLVILVEPANGRYMIGAMGLLPAAVAVWAAHSLSDLRARPMAPNIAKHRRSRRDRSLPTRQGAAIPFF